MEIEEMSACEEAMDLARLFLGRVERWCPVVPPP
jgi:hypothetical protein